MGTTCFQPRHSLTECLCSNLSLCHAGVHGRVKNEGVDIDHRYQIFMTVLSMGAVLCVMQGLGGRRDRVVAFGSDCVLHPRLVVGLGAHIGDEGLRQEVGELLHGRLLEPRLAPQLRRQETVRGLQSCKGGLQATPHILSAYIP